jgi:hypothetical protein
VGGIWLLLISLAILLLSIQDDAYKIECVSCEHGKLACLPRYFLFWVLPYWWVLILLTSFIVAIIGGIVQRK